MSAGTPPPTVTTLQHPTFKPLLGQLARLSFASAALHQLVFTLSSRLPFAVGQPQDVGLIFLSSMASGEKKKENRVDVLCVCVVGGGGMEAETRSAG